MGANLFDLSGEVAAVTGAIVLLASGASAHLTSQMILVHGGIGTGATRATSRRREV
ncbi:MAG: hypothetical protein K6U03_01375 [Firmicutes bacterium]|nr:hypothetical protein [Bacillota bacterium]